MGPAVNPYPRQNRILTVIFPPLRSPDALVLVRWNLTTPKDYWAVRLRRVTANKNPASPSSEVLGSGTTTVPLALTT
jgi:hypothetical protein